MDKLNNLKQIKEIGFNGCLAGWQLHPVFIFANQAGLDMLETTLVALQDVSLDKIFDEAGRKALCNVVPQVMQQVNFGW